MLSQRHHLRPHLLRQPASGFQHAVGRGDRELPVCGNVRGECRQAHGQGLADPEASEEGAWEGDEPLADEV